MPGRISVISFSEHGFKFQDSLKADIDQWAALQDMETVWYCKDKAGFGIEGYIPVMVPTKEWSANRFEDSDIIVYFCTVAKAVRNFAPSMRGQTEDPAVLAIDQQGRYSVPVLSGKKGEAYELSLWLEEKSGITAVNSGGIIQESGFSVEKFAKENDMIISNVSYAREITAALDSGEKIGFYTSFPVKGDLPEGVEWSERGPLGINLSPSYLNAYFAHTLWLIPKCLEIGISLTGDNIIPKDIELAINDLLRDMNVYPESISSINAVDSVNTSTLRIVCDNFDYPLKVYKQEELEELKSVLPTLQYCECAALKNGGSNILKKMSSIKGIEMAVAMKKIYVDFR